MQRVVCTFRLCRRRRIRARWIRAAAARRCYTLDDMLHLGWFATVWVVCYTLGVMLHFGCYVTLWVLCYSLGVMQYFGCYVTVWVLCNTLVVMLHFGCYATLWVLCYTLVVMLHFNDARAHAGGGRGGATMRWSLQNSSFTSMFLQHISLARPSA